MIQQRQDGVEYFFKAPEFAELCTDCLGRVGDVERLVSKAAVEESIRANSNNYAWRWKV